MLVEAQLGGLGIVLTAITSEVKEKQTQRILAGRKWVQIFCYFKAEVSKAQPEGTTKKVEISASDPAAAPLELGVR